MARPPIPVLFSQGMGGNACHIAYPRHVVLIGHEAADKLEGEQLGAIISHELGHYQRYHAERASALWLLTWLLTIAFCVLGWWLLAGAFFVTARYAGWLMIHFLHEAEADDYAARAVSPQAVHDALMKLGSGRCRSTKWRLRRLKLMTPAETATKDRLLDS